MVKTCHMCHGHSDDYDEAKLKRCSGCQKVYYCSTSCQKYDWVYHIFDCKPRRPINTSDYLALAVRKGQLPEDSQACEDYGFNRAFTSMEKSFLLGLYVGLIDILKVPPKTIHEWRVRGVLVEEIKAAFYKVPEHCRGLYFPWFLQNEHIIALAGQPLSEELMHDRGDAMLVRAWRFTGGSEGDSADEVRAATKRKPIEEQKCHHMYALLLSGWHPSPDVELWLDFGFASCASQEEEVMLAARYGQLIMKCAFEEFCDAFRERRLLDLFGSKGLQIGDNAQLRDLLCAKWRKSVWYLKLALQQEDAAKGTMYMHPAVVVDYGFANCRNDSERRQLARVYKAFFESVNGDALALHEAAIQGNIHGYLSTVVQGLRDPKFQRLMKNPYPLPDL